MPLVKAKDGAAIYYEIHGDGEPLLLVSGLGGNASFWDQQVARLKASYQVVTYDHRGAGRSTLSRIHYSVEQMASDAIALLDGLSIDRAHVVGHSTGGCVAQTLAIDHAERVGSLVLSATWMAADAYFERVFQARTSALDYGGVASYVRLGTLFQVPPRQLAENIRAIEEGERAAIAQFPPVEIVQSKIKALLRFDRSAELRRIGAPALVMTAADDLMCPPHLSEALAAEIPHGRLIILPTGGHFCPRIEPDAYFASLHDFLNSTIEAS